MLGKLEKVAIQELKFESVAAIEKGGSFVGQLRNEAQFAVEPGTLSEYAIILRMSFAGFNSNDDPETSEPLFSTSCKIVGFFPVGRKIVEADRLALTEEVTVRANLQLYPIARGKLLRLLNEAGFNNPDIPLENSFSFPLVAIPGDQVKKKATRRPRKPKSPAK